MVESRLGRNRNGKQRGLFVLAAILLTVGAVLVVTSFVLLIADRNSRAAKPTVARSIANRLEQAGLGCDDYTSFTPIGKGILNDVQCRTNLGNVRIVVYRSPKAAEFARNLSRNFECINKAAVGETTIVTVVHGVWELDPASADPAAADAMRDAAGGKVVTVDCAAPAPAAPPPPDPAAEAPPA